MEQVYIGGMMRGWKILVLSVSSLVLLSSATASSRMAVSEGGGEAHAVVGHTGIDEPREIVGLFTSYGFSQRINGSAEIDIQTVGFRWSRIRENPVGWSFLEGRPSLALELLPAVIFSQAKGAYGMGAHIAYEHRLATVHHAQPILRLGIGGIRADVDVPDGETKLNWSIFVGAGVEIPVKNGVALALEYRLHHISNGGVGAVNPGINTHTVSTGLSFDFR